MKKYYYYNVKKNISVERLVTLEYLTLDENFYFPKEKHPFNELVYVENGCINCVLKDKNISLSKNNLFFIGSNTEHQYNIEKNNAATIFIICFKSSAEILDILDEPIIISRENRQVIANILEEARKTFKFPFDEKLSQLNELYFGGQQMVETYIEELLIKLCREKLYDKKDIKLFLSNDELWAKVTEDVIEILKKNLYSKLTLSDISKRVFYSKTLINIMFKKITGKTVMLYYNALKIEESKKLLKANVPVSEISELLNYESANYYSKVFKKFTSLTPLQYKKQ